MKKISMLLLSFLLVSGLSVSAQDAPQGPQGDVGYAFGLLMGQNLAGTGIEVSVDQVVQGLRDALKPNAKTQITTEEAKFLVNMAFAEAQEKVAAEKLGQEKTWLAEHAKKAGVITTASGLQYEVLVKGPGKKPTAEDLVKVDYTGSLVDGTEFDSSIKRGEPAVFPLSQVIPAWTEGIQLMGVGDRYRFTVPSSLAYGAEGAGNGVIPAYATLIFEVELLSIEKSEPDAQ